MHGTAVDPTLDIIDTLLAEASFHSLLGALQSVGLVDPLKGSGPLTLLAPTDQAFAELAGGDLLNLEKPENHATLKLLLQGHVLKGSHDLNDIRQRLAIESITGAQYQIVSSGQGVTIGGSRLVETGIRCTNGMIHVLDRVLSPPV